MRMGCGVFEPLIGLAFLVFTRRHHVFSMVNRYQIADEILSIKCLGIQSLDIKLFGLSLFSIKSLDIFYAKQGGFYWKVFRGVKLRCNTKEVWLGVCIR